MLRLSPLAAAVAAQLLIMAGPALPAGLPEAPDTAALIAANSYPFVLADGRISGPGEQFLNRVTANSQFVLLGESHFDHDTPLFASALFRVLHREHRFDRLVVEQDGVGVADLMKPGVAGDVKAMAAVAKRYPNLIGFASDQDLQLLADVATEVKGADPVWGLEQARDAARYLEELETLATAGEAKARVSSLLAEARSSDHRDTPGKFLHDDPTTYARLQALQADFGAKPGSRADELLTALVKSAEIYSYDRRANQGEYVGLLNNTVRETWFKQSFIRRYRIAAAGGTLPKAMFKFGDNHMFHGLNPEAAFPIGTFAHEFAIWNGMEAYAIEIIPLGSFAKPTDHPSWMRVLFPNPVPTQPTVIDLRPLRNYQRLYRVKLQVEDQANFREFINGYDAIVILPNSRKATFEQTGFAWTPGN